MVICVEAWPGLVHPAKHDKTTGEMGWKIGVLRGCEERFLHNIGMELFVYLLSASD